MERLHLNESVSVEFHENGRLVPPVLELVHNTKRDLEVHKVCHSSDTRFARYLHKVLF